MTHNLCDNRPLMVPITESNISNIKQEFSNIFYEYNLDAFAEAGELGFFNNNKSPLRPQAITSEGNESTQDDTQKKDLTPQNGALKSSVYSPAAFFRSNVNLTANNVKTSNPELGVSRRPSQNLEQSPFLNIQEFFQTQEYTDTHADEPLNLIWSNEPSNIAEQRTSNSCVLPLKFKKEEPRNRGQNYVMKKLEANDLQSDYLSYSNPLEYFSKPEKDFPSRMKIKREEEEEEHEGLERTFSMRVPDFDKPALPGGKKWNPPIKRAETLPEGDDDPEGKNRSSRGLRVLSLRVKDIVSEKRKTSYKEVADVLTEEILQNMKGKEESRDEQNVKRRAYDALNVLIAADILKKDGKVVYCDDDVSSIGTHRRKQMKEEKEGLEKRLFELKKKNKSSAEGMKELLFKYLAIQNLVRRNKHNVEETKQIIHNSETESTSEESGKKLISSNTNYSTTRIDVVKDRPDFKFNNEDVIRFPFIVLVSSTPENSINLATAKEKKRLVIESTSPFNIFGDIDILLKMKLHWVSYDFVKQCIPKEIESYLSKSDLDIFKH